MPSVPLHFAPPTDEGIVALRIQEAPTKDGPFVQIERTTAVGTFPNYIDHYTTNLATNVTDWFSIQWEDDKGALSQLSLPVQGGTQTLPNKIAERVMLRDSTLDENVVLQEAEAAIEGFYGVDPYTVDATTPSYRELSGLTMMTLALSYLMVLYSQSGGEKWTAGLLSLDTTATAKRQLADIEKYLERANGMLGRSYSLVMLMEEITVGGGLKQLVSVDITRTIVEYE